MCIRDRRNIAHGPFWLGKFGFFSNIVLLGWTVFSVVFFSFPPVLPVTKDNMNYVCVVIVGYTAYSILYWKYKGKKEFHALEESENEQAEYSNNFDTIEDSREFSVAASDVELENEHVPWGKK